jgi:hypothetical protein
MKENVSLSKRIVYLKKMVEKLSMVHGFSISEIKVKLSEMEDIDRYKNYNELLY